MPPLVYQEVPVRHPEVGDPCFKWRGSFHAKVSLGIPPKPMILKAFISWDFGMNKSWFSWDGYMLSVRLSNSSCSLGRLGCKEQKPSLINSVSSGHKRPTPGPCRGRQVFELTHGFSQRCLLLPSLSSCLPASILWAGVWRCGWGFHQVFFLSFFLRCICCGSVLKSLLNLLQYCFCSMFWFFSHKARGTPAPQAGIEPAPPALP